jgi:hypothetical protein
MTTTKRTQSGSAGGVLVLAIIVILMWWQWDRIEGMVGGGGGAIAEVSGFTCTSSGGRSLMEGRIRNVSKEPVSFRALVNVNDTTGRRIETQEIGVRPSPVPPDQGGEFRGEGPAMPDGGSCKLDNVLNAETGYPVKFRRR